MSDVEKAQTLPASKLGEYKVVKEIAEGTFGKVKSTFHVSYRVRELTDRLALADSGDTHCYGTYGRYEVLVEAGDQYDEDEEQGTARGGVYARVAASAHYQAVRYLSNKLPHVPIQTPPSTKPNLNV